MLNTVLCKGSEVSAKVTFINIELNFAYALIII